MRFAIHPRASAGNSKRLLEPAKESTIITQGITGDRELRIVLVDEEMTMSFFKRIFSGWAIEVKVPPGKHDIRLIYKTLLWHNVRDFWIVACSGKIYIAKAQTLGYQTDMWIEDKETGKRVGGNKGSEDEPKSIDVSCDQRAQVLKGRAAANPHQNRHRPV